MWLTGMIHKTGRNLIFNSAPCQHCIPSFSVAREPAPAFPIYLRRKEKERQGGEGRGCVSPHLQLAHQSNRTGFPGAPEGTPVKAWCHSRCPLLTRLNNNRRSCLSPQLALSQTAGDAVVAVIVSSDRRWYAQLFPEDVELAQHC